MSNRLIHATSPYLLQHAHNPVDWYPWGDEALEKARREDKPILVSIGYSACHWCHVMERECFENADIAALMNRLFVCIKVDREERPDVDQVYMEAVQAMGINGGWPLNVFLTPEQKPFYGGTYFPPKNWAGLLSQIGQSWQQRRGEIDRSADELTRHLNRSDIQRFAASTDSQFEHKWLEQMFSILTSRFDSEFGGLDKAPKFVMPTIWQFLLRYFAITKDEAALDMVTVTIREMTRAGLYDQVGGGFARYSVDGEWGVPHFEKMLYDNAQLLSLYADMYRVTRDEYYREIVYQTFGWIQREMTHSDGAFYSALDADSEGVEGKFYTWTYDEAKEVLGNSFHDAAAFFNILPEGNWEHGRNILFRDVSKPSTDEVKSWQQTLLAARGNRIRPGLDHKILAGWNAMTIKGLTDAYLAFADRNFLDAAVRCMGFIEQNLMEGSILYRNNKTTEGFLEDYAFLIQAYLGLYQASGNEAWLGRARSVCHHVIEHFSDEDDPFFRFSSRNAPPLIASKKEIFDNVIPASNSVMATNLFWLGTILDESSWRDRAIAMVRSLATSIAGEPAYMSNWGALLATIIHGISEVAIVGPESELFRKQFTLQYLPFTIVQATKHESELPLLKGKTSATQTTVFVCHDRRCDLPVTSVEEAFAQLGYSGY